MRCVLPVNDVNHVFATLSSLLDANSKGISTNHQPHQYAAQAPHILRKEADLMFPYSLVATA